MVNLISAEISISVEGHRQNHTLYSIIKLLKYNVFENIMENGAFGSIFHNNPKSFQNSIKSFLIFFQCNLKIENDVII